jgi:prophage tail gpP-like protein
MTEVALKIDGKDYLDFLSVSIRYSMESFARDFSVDFTDRFYNDLLTQGDLPFAEGSHCQISVDGEVVVDGFIDDIPISYDSTSHSIQVSGRSWHGMLVDCSAVHKTGHWKAGTLLKMCNDVAAPFGATVKYDPELLLQQATLEEPFRKWAIDDEETAHDFIARACKMRGLFPIADVGKTVVLSRASIIPSGGTLVRARNGIPGKILRGRRNGRYRERYSQYIVKSQSAGFDDWYGEDAASKGVFIAEDSDIDDYRPLIIVSDGQGAKADLEVRAGSATSGLAEAAGLHTMSKGPRNWARLGAVYGPSTKPFS